MPTLEIKREQPKARIVTMGQSDQEIEYEEFYPPGATEPILREKKPDSKAPASTPVAETDDPAVVDEYGDGVRVNEKGEKVPEFGTLNKKTRSTSAPKEKTNEPREKEMANDQDLDKVGVKTIREDKPGEQGAVGSHGKN